MQFSLYHKMNTVFLSWVFSINPRILGDDNRLAWTNLGYWDEQSSNYIQAAETLAVRMGKALELEQKDYLLDIGCGHGASLKLWKKSFKLDLIDALELQKQCCEKIRRERLEYIQQVFEQSIFDVLPKSKLKQYDAIISLDATYHYPVQKYLAAIELYSRSQTRIGFHTLVHSKRFEDLTLKEQTQLAKILKLAKVNVQHLLVIEDLDQLLKAQKYKNVEIVDMTEQVLKGFSDYVHKRKMTYRWIEFLDYLKIKTTAKLCAYLADQGVVRYVQVTAQKI